MGAFVIYNKNQNFNFEDLKIGFKERSFEEPSYFDIGNFKLLLYKKIAVEHINFLSINDDHIFVTGTVIYKKQSYQESLLAMLNDKINDQFDYDQLLGHFTIIFYIKGKLFIIKDRANIYSVFYNSTKTILSSSFLAVVNAHSGKLSPDRNAITEILITGSLIGSATIFNEIKRIDNKDHLVIDGLEFESFKENTNSYCKKNYNECVNEQIKTLDDYFDATKDLANSVGVDSGLTGGFDSRLLFILGTRHYKFISLHSHWRKVKSLELECAEKICEKKGLPLNVVSAIYPQDMSEEYLHNVLNAAFCFYDGQVRSHCYWTEEYNTLAHRRRVINRNGLGLHGIGGEQYRNEERMLWKWSAKSWIKNDLIYRYSGDCFLNTSTKNAFYEYYKNKISNTLEKKIEGFVDHLTVKTFLNEIFIPSNRATRTNAENGMMFFLSPFAEYSVAHKAYEAISHFGLSTDFQKDMIKQLDPEVAGVMSDYGYNFFEGEPLKLKLFTLIKEMLPKILFYKLLHKIKKSNNDTTYSLMENKFSFFSEYEKYVSKLELPINIEYLKKKADLAPLIISIGFILKKYNNKIRYSNLD